MPGAFTDDFPELPIVVIHGIMIPLIYTFYARLAREDNIALHINLLKTQNSPRFQNQNANRLWNEVIRFSKGGTGKEFALWEMIEMSLTFIIYHEVAHLVRHHADFLPNTTGLTISEETSGTALTIREALTYQVLEFDADRYSTEWVIMRLLQKRGVSHFSRSDVNEWHRVVYQDEQRFTTNLALSIFVGFRLFYNAASENPDLMHLKRHPPVLVRWLMAVSQALLIFRDRRESKVVSALERTLNWELLEGIYCKITGEGFGTKGRDFATSELAQAYFKCLVQRYERFSNQRLPFIGEWWQL